MRWLVQRSWWWLLPFLLTPPSCSSPAWDSGNLHPRPLPSHHDLPVLQLIEPPGMVYDPPPNDLDPVALHARLGNHFDSRVMSIQRPFESVTHPNGSLDFGFKHNKKGRLVPVGRLPRALRRLDLSHVALPDGRRLRTNLSAKLKRKFQQLLWAVTACPVLHVWKELGVRFWPRWIREGHCVRPTPHGNAPMSCSFPRGMTCKPSRSASKVILRWHCRDWEPKPSECAWIHIRYPLITECACSC